MSHSLLRARRAVLAGLVAISCAIAAVVAAQPAFAVPNCSTISPYDSNAGDIGYCLFLMINSERAANRLPGLTSDSRLRIYSTTRHSLQMERYNTLSHQLPGEPALGTRAVLAGFTPWRLVGENVAYNTDMTWRGAQYVERLMYNEVAPNNGHRLNILSTGYKHMGTNVLMDTAHHKMWITVDFGTLW